MHCYRRIGITGIAAIASLTLMAGCSGSPSTAPSTSSAPGSLKGASITFMMLGANQKTEDYLKKDLIPAFTEKTGIKVTLQTSDWGPAFQKYTTAAAANQLADVITMGAIWTAPLASKGALLDLDTYMSKWQDKDQLFPDMLKDGAWEGKQYAVPFGLDLRIPVYRKDILSKAGVDTTKLPTTWEQFEEVARKVKESGQTESPIFWGIDKSIGLQQGFAQLMMQNDAEYWTADGKANFSSPKAKEALEFMVKTFNEGLANYHLVYSGSGARPLVGGQSGLGLGSRNDFLNAETSSPEIAKELLVGPPLAGPSAQRGAVGAWTNKLAISKASKNPEAAFEFIKFILSKDVLSTFDQTYGTLPVRSDLADAEWLGTVGKALMESAKFAKSQPTHPGMMQFGGEINKLLEPAIRGSVGVEETLKAIDEKLNAFKG